MITRKNLETGVLIPVLLSDRKPNYAGQYVVGNFNSRGKDEWLEIDGTCIWDPKNKQFVFGSDRDKQPDVWFEFRLQYNNIDHI